MRQGVRLGSSADEPTTPDAPPPPAPCEAHSVRLHSRWTNPFRQLSATKSDSTRGKVRTSTSLGREFDGLLTPQGALPMPPEERPRRQPLDESDDLVPANSCADPGGTKPSKEDPREWRMSPCTPSHMRSKSSATPRSSLVELHVNHGETRDKQSNEDTANSGRGWTNPFAAPSSFSRDSPRSWKMPPSTPRHPSHPHPATPQPSVVTSTPKRPLARLLSLPSLPSCKYSRTTSGTPKQAARPAVNTLPSAAVEASEDEISDEDLKSRPEQTAQPQLVTPIAPARRQRQQLLSSQEQKESVQSNCATDTTRSALVTNLCLASSQVGEAQPVRAGAKTGSARRDGLFKTRITRIAAREEADANELHVKFGILGPLLPSSDIISSAVHNKELRHIQLRLKSTICSAPLTEAMCEVLAECGVEVPPRVVHVIMRRATFERALSCCNCFVVFAPWLATKHDALILAKHCEPLPSAITG